MMPVKLQVAGAPALDAVALRAERSPAEQLRRDRGSQERRQSNGDATSRGGALLYSGVALGVLAGAAVSTYLWRQRVRALNLLNVSPLERAEELISSCESKLEDIERAFEKLKEAR